MPGNTHVDLAWTVAKTSGPALLSALVDLPPYVGTAIELGRIVKDGAHLIQRLEEWKVARRKEHDDPEWPGAPSGTVVLNLLAETDAEQEAHVVAARADQLRKHKDWLWRDFLGWLLDVHPKEFREHRDDWKWAQVHRDLKR